MMKMSCGSCFRGCKNAKSILKGVEYQLPTNLSVTDYFHRSLLVEGNIPADSTAILSADGKSPAFTFAQLDSLSTKLAKALRQCLGFFSTSSKDGDLVIAFSLPISEIVPVVIMAILKLGAAFIAIPILYAEQHIIKLVGMVRPMLVIIEPSQPIISRYECVSGLLSIIHLNDILSYAETGEFDDINEVFPLEALLPPCKRVASIVYTAGTMDQQLAVRLGHVEILNRCLWQYKTFPYQGNEVASLSSFLEDVDSIAEIFAPLLAGIPLHLIPRSVLANPSALILRILETKISRITLAPPGLDALLRELERMNQENSNQKRLSSLKYLTVSGDALTFELAQRFFQLLCNELDCHDCSQDHIFRRRSRPVVPKGDRTISETSIRGSHTTILIHLYGSTEVMSDVSYETFARWRHLKTKFREEKVSIGKPIGNTIIYVVDENMKIVEEGTIGEIYVAGACVATGGYVGGTSKEDSDRFCPNPFTKRKRYSTIYRTEDFGRIAEGADGVSHLFFEGRTESIAKVKGKKIDLRDIAKTVNETKLVEQCTVFCYHPGMEDQVIVACCKLLPEVAQETLETTLCKSIQDPDFVPQVFPVDEFHYLPSGRLDKHKMFKKYRYYTTNAKKSTQ